MSNDNDNEEIDFLDSLDPSRRRGPSPSLSLSLSLSLRSARSTCRRPLPSSTSFSSLSGSP